MQKPRPEQSAAHGVFADDGSGSAHAAPVQPTAQTQRPPPGCAWHTPWPEQSSGHGSARRQLAPEKPGKQSHAPPCRQTPAPEQSSA
eukprot:6394129-Prymnesium_polylepis.1